MSEENKEFDETLNTQDLPENEAAENKNENETAADTTPAEESSWQFEAEAMTLQDTTLENEEFEIDIPAEKPKAAAPPVAAAPVAVPAKKRDTNITKFLIAAILGVIIVGVCVFFGIQYYTVPNSEEKMNPGNVALTVNDTDVSIGMYNYYYTAVVNNYLQYANYGYYNIDTTVDYAKQPTQDADGKNTTWAKVFQNDTINQIQYMTSYYEAAVKAGTELTEEQKSTMKEQLDYVKESASSSDLSVDKYISQTYGEYCGYATLKKMLTQGYLAQNYYTEHSVETKATDEEIEKYFNDHKGDYTSVGFAYLQMPYDTEDDASRTKVEKEAVKYAKDIKTIKDLKKALPNASKDLIDQYVSAGYFENAEEGAETLAANVETTLTQADTSFTEEGINWLFSEQTKVGDCSTFTDTENGIVYIILKTAEPVVDDTEVYTVRHILVMPHSEEEEKETEADEHAEENKKDIEYTEAQWAQAKKKADKILKKFNSGKKTEYEFALLAEEYSEDTESTSNGQSGAFGGIIASTPLGTMVKPFEEWSIDKARKYGDTDIVKSKFGYHVMFFVKDTQKYLADVESAVVAEKEDQFVDSAVVKQHKSGMKKTKVQQPVAATEENSTNAAK